jgi:16S rRNA (guanine527-N7)-methyltransferase
MSPEAALEIGLQELNLPLARGRRAQILRYLALLAKWNRTFNLTAIREPAQMVSHHVLDALAVLPALPDGTLADVGSGAGVPGIPIAIAQPERTVTLNDANAKKVSFLRQAIIELQLRNCRVHAGRVEAWFPIEKFQVVISRAFAELARLLACCRHLVAADGVLAAMKGTDPRGEIAALDPGCDCSDVRRLRVPLLDAERHLVICRFAAR